MLVYFIRHGESEENIGGPYMGLDSPLTSLGREQASSVAERFGNIPIDIILASDMERAKKTAKEVSRVTGKKIEYSPLLREMDAPSELLGKTPDDPELLKVREEWFDKRFEDESYQYSDEETIQAAKKRARDAISLIEKHGEEKIAVVTHGTFLRMIAGVMAMGEAFPGRIFERLRTFLRVKNTGITVCQFEEGEWRLITWNDHAHLSEILNTKL